MAVAVRRVIVAVVAVAWRGAAEIVVLIAVKLECKTALGAVVVAVLKFAIREPWLLARSNRALGDKPKWIS